MMTNKKNRTPADLGPEREKNTLGKHRPLGIGIKTGSDAIGTNRLNKFRTPTVLA